MVGGRDVYAAAASPESAKTMGDGCARVKAPRFQTFLNFDYNLIRTDRGIIILLFI